MSLHSEEGVLTESGESFWEPRNYRRTTKRIDDGYKLCHDLIQLVQERAEIEKSHATRLKAFASKWGESVKTGPEYGTTEAAWKGLLSEADRLSDLHTQIRDELTDDVVNSIRNWQKGNYHKKLLGLKESSDMGDQFKKVQKPWEKLLAKVSKAKQDYQNACKTEQAAITQEQVASKDSTLPRKQVKKLEDKVTKAKEEVESARKKYEDAVEEINKYQSTYVQEMKGVFDKCQEMEGKRLEFFKQAMLNIQKCVNISNKEDLVKIYQDMYQTIENANPEEDLRWWSNNFGADMEMNKISFEEEYREPVPETKPAEPREDAMEKKDSEIKIPDNPFEEEEPEKSTKAPLDPNEMLTLKEFAQERIAEGTQVQVSSSEDAEGKNPFEDEPTDLVTQNLGACESNPFEDEEVESQLQTKTEESDKEDNSSNNVKEEGSPFEGEEDDKVPEIPITTAEANAASIQAAESVEAESAGVPVESSNDEDAVAVSKPPRKPVPKTRQSVLLMNKGSTSD